MNLLNEWMNGIYHRVNIHDGYLLKLPDLIVSIFRLFVNDDKLQANEQCIQLIK